MTTRGRIGLFSIVILLSISWICLAWGSEKELPDNWTNAGYFKLEKIDGRQIFIDPDGKPFYSIGMVYAYGPDRGPISGIPTAERVIKELTLMKEHGFNTLNLYGELFLDEMLSWCDENKMAVYFRTTYTPYLSDFPQKLSEFPDFMSPEFREPAKHRYDKFLNTIKKYHSVLAIDMDQRWLFGIDYGGNSRYGTPMLGPEGVKHLPVWLKEKYGGDIDKLNKLWRKKYISFDDVLEDTEIIINGAVKDLKRYPWRVDIVEYTQWTINDFLKELTSYMKSVDPNHLITYTTDWQEIIPFPISTKENSGLDFISPVHYNAMQDFRRDWISNGELLYFTKWTDDLYKLPVYISETGSRTSSLEQKPSNMTYAMSEKDNEVHQAQMYLEQTTLMDTYPWFVGWAWFEWNDKYVEGDFGYVRDDRSLRPISKLGRYINDKIAINMKAEKKPQVWIYYPEYALASPFPSFPQYKSLVLMLENDFLTEHEKMINEALKFVIIPDKSISRARILNDLPKVFDEKWIPFAFTFTIPEDDNPIILAGRALEQLSVDDRKALAGKRTITIGPIGISDERYNDVGNWYAEVAGIVPQDYAREIVQVQLDKLFNNDGISWDKNRKDGDFDGQGNSFAAEELPSGNEVFSAQEGIGFIFPDNKDGALNNIKCDGQVIKVTDDSYIKVYFLAASHSGDICGKAVLNYADGASETKYLSKTVTDWRHQPTFTKTGAASRLRNATKDTDEDVYISQVPISCSAGKKLVSIKLPVEGSIHIFAVSLTKGGVVEDSQITVSTIKGNKQSGVTTWMLSLNAKEGAPYKVLATFENGKPAIVGSQDGRHIVFLYDSLTWYGSDKEISRDVTGGARILKEVLF